MMIITSENDENEILNKLKLNNLLHRFNTDVLSLTITPTLSCNFDCSYCYEKNKDNIFMTNETEEKVIDFIKSYGAISELYITWFGGEPFMFFKRIKSLSDKLKKMEINVINSIVSNGFILSKPILDWMRNNKMGYIQITLDGLEDTHNLKRPHKKGRNSFLKIIKNLDVLFSTDINIDIIIRTNISAENEKEYHNLTEFIVNRYQDKRLRLSPNFVIDMNDTQNLNNCMFNRTQKAQFKLNNINTKGIGFYPQLKTFDCIARQRNGFVVGANGELYKCFEDIGNGNREIGNINNKNSFNEDLLTKYLIGADQMSDKECIDCKLLPICNGGCPYIRIKNMENGMPNSDNCEILRNFEKEFLLSHLEQKNIKN